MRRPAAAAVAAAAGVPRWRTVTTRRPVGRRRQRRSTPPATGHPAPLAPGNHFQTILVAAASRATSGWQRRRAVAVAAHYRCGGLQRGTCFELRWARECRLDCRPAGASSHERLRIGSASRSAQGNGDRAGSVSNTIRRNQAAVARRLDSVYSDPLRLLQRWLPRLELARLLCCSPVPRTCWGDDHVRTLDQIPRLA